MEEKEKSSLGQTLLIIGAVIAVVAAAILVLTRMEKQLRRVCYLAEKTFRKESGDFRIEL